MDGNDVDNCLSRLHRVITEYEGGGKDRLYVENAYKYFDEQMFKPSQPGEETEMQIGWDQRSALDVLSLMVRIVLIVSGKHKLVSQLGSSAGKLLVMMTNNEARTDSITQLNSNSLMEHFQAFGEDLAIIVETLAQYPETDLSACHYDFFLDTPRYPVKISFDSIATVSSLISFWATAVAEYFNKHENFSNSIFHSRNFGPLVHFVNNLDRLDLDVNAVVKVLIYSLYYISPHYILLFLKNRVLFKLF